MKSRKKFLWLSPVLALPIFATISCSKQNYYPNELVLDNLVSLIRANQIKINAEFKTQTNSYTINDLANNQTIFKLEINKPQTNKETNFEQQNNNDYWNQVNYLINACELKYINVLIPKPQMDLNTYFVFESKYKNTTKKFLVQFNQIKKSNNLEFRNLTNLEIQQMIKNKLNSTFNYVNDFSSFLNLQFKQLNQISQASNSSTLPTQWSSEFIYNHISTKLLSFFNQYDFFDINQYQNIYLDPSSLSIIQNKNQKTYIFRFKLFTASTNDSNDYYLGEIPFNLN